MRRMLAGFLATSMIVAVASSVTFAATVKQSVGVAAINWKEKPNVTPVGFDASDTFGTVNPYKETITLGEFHLEVSYNSESIYAADIPNTLKAFTTGTITATNGTSGSPGTPAKVETAIPASDATIAKKDITAAIMKIVKPFTTQIGGNLYTFSFSVDSAGNLYLESNASTMPAGVDVDITYPNATTELTPTEVVSTADSTHKATLSITANPSLTDVSFSSRDEGKEIADVDQSGALESLPISAVVLCDGSGNPIVLTENKSGIDADQNSENGVQSGKTLYFMLRDGADAPVPKLNDDTFWKLKITKGDNSKCIKSISDVEKNFTNGLYRLDDTSATIETTKGRHRFIKVELNENYTDEEYKVTMDLRLSPKSKAIDAKLLVEQPDGSKIQVSDEDEIKVNDFYFYMKNIVKAADNDWKVGVGGLMLNPISNDWNEVTYYDEDGDLAFMKFFADSDVSKFYSKLSTKWEHADYASYFNDQDAYIFDFVGSPKISATSRCDLQIYNPFVNGDGDETIDPETAVIYQVVDGDLFDVTDNFTYEEGENGDMAFVTRTRFLGTYIICEKAVEEAEDDTEEVPEITPAEQAPEEVTPGGNDGGKAPANTGKYA